MHRHKFSLLVACVLLLGILACQLATGTQQPRKTTTTATAPEATEAIVLTEVLEPMEVVVREQQEMPMPQSEFEELMGIDGKLADLNTLLNEQGYTLIDSALYSLLSDNTLVLLFGFTDGINQRAVIQMTSAEGDFSTFILDLLENGYSLSDREGKAEITVEDNVARIVVYDRDGNVLMDSLQAQQGEVMLASWQKQFPVLQMENICTVTGWDIFARCIHPKKELWQTGKCAAAIIASKASCAAAAVPGTQWFTVYACKAAVTAMVFNCGEWIRKCWWDAWIDSPAECDISGWEPTGKTRKTWYQNGWVQAKVWQTRISCKDERDKCCRFVPAGDVVEAYSSEASYTSAYDCAGNETRVYWKAPDLSQEELATYEEQEYALPDIKWSGSWTRTKPGGICEAWGWEATVDYVELVQSNKTVTGKGAFYWRCYTDEARTKFYDTFIDMVFTGETGPRWTGTVEVMNNDEPAFTLTWFADQDTAGRKLNLHVGYDKDSARSWGSAELQVSK